MEAQNLLGFLLPPIIDLINNKIESPQGRFWASFGVCAIVGVLLNMKTLLPFPDLSDVSSILDFMSRFFANLAVVFTTAQLTYKVYWEKSDARHEFKKTL